MPRRFGFGLGFNISRLSGLPEPSGFVAKYQSYDVDDFTLVTGSNVSQWDDRTTQTFGSEEVTNGDFSDGSTGWTVQLIWSIAGGKATSDGSSSVAGNRDLRQNGVFAVGKTYELTFDIVNYTNGALRIFDGSTVIVPTSLGTKTLILKPTVTDLIFNGGTEAFIGSIDNISVKEVLTGANHLTQGTSTNQPILTQDANRFNNTVDFGPDDFMEGLPVQSGDFTYVIKGSDVPNYLTETNIFIGQSGQNTARLVNVNGTLSFIDDSNTTVFSESWSNESNIAVTLSDTTLKVYADSTQLGSDIDVTGSSFNSIDTVGNSTNSINGSLQELYVYDRALTQDEINWFSYLRDENNNISPVPPLLPS